MRPAGTARHWIGILASVIPYFILSYILVDVWRNPMAWDDGRWVRYGVGLMALEFVLVHSGAFMGAIAASREKTSSKIKVFAGLLFMYSLFAIGLSAAIGSVEILYVYGSVMAGRFITIVTVSGEGKQVMSMRSAISISLYLVAVFASVLLPVPELGIDATVLNDVYPDRGNGEWERHPERAIAGAALYFALLGLAELLILGPRTKIMKPATG